MADKVYIAIDLKSFYASVECVERGLDPLNTNLVVADKSRTDKTICLAVSPSLKAHGISSRPRLFEVVQQVAKVNNDRKRCAPGHKFTGRSFFDNELRENPSSELDYIVAVPQMALYIDYSSRIYRVYLKYVAPEDIHVYSIDEVFIDATVYIKTRKTTRHNFVRTIIKDVLDTTGITATAGIGTNLYLAKVAMDIMAKKTPADKDGVRIARLDEISYRQQLWDHRPLTDFWRVGRGYAKKLEERGLFTMGDIARCSLGGRDSFYNEDMLYKLFGVNAQLLIDHAWGYEPCTIEMIKSYKPRSHSIGQGQVLQEPYSYDKALIVVKEMAQWLALDLLDKKIMTDQVVLTVGYDTTSLNSREMLAEYSGRSKIDHYGRLVPKHAHGTQNFDRYTDSLTLITNATEDIFTRTVDEKLLIRRITICAGNIMPSDEAVKIEKSEQVSLFTDFNKLARQEEATGKFLNRERNLRCAVLDIKRKYGKNAILHGLSFEEGATARQRNTQIGGHKA